MSTLLNVAQQGLDEIIAIRRDIHAHPELGFEETRTAAVIAEKLRSWGVEVTEGIATTGVVGTVRGRRAGARSIGLRADMDALSIGESNALAHASKVPGRMHACGHDGHTAMLLGAARALAENPDFEGTVHLIFQPAEEALGGAPAMLQEQLFERFPCDRIFGMHSYPALPVGSFGTRPKEMMAASGRFRVVFKGSGGHGGEGPHRSNDLSVVAAHFILGLQSIVSRNLAPTESAVVSVGHLGAGDAKALSVMPAELTIAGTMRAFNPQTQTLLETRIRAHAETYAQSEGATAEVTCWWLCVPLFNTPDATLTAVSAATDVVGPQAVQDDLPRITAGDDFAYMLHQRPGAYMLIGNGRHDGDGGGNVHSPHYDFNDKVLPYGIAYWLSLVNQELGGRLGRA
ncbi:M20 aminoacylase family protein [Hydrogenophaga sp. BPS33]|uniref:M20 aminoacylase family protein n=1 Tax=Hydrogenophaga sp. BPS33 TaxID=2651974 RepID=UPI00131FCF91|nr:M20 aminoacylase family protein [Hydrogenophaga sp. BPS33]QHE87638.1 amidohydrolase [Hydrogenophaga sp. BPS33]